jgi:hypothetical protein
MVQKFIRSFSFAGCVYLIWYAAFVVVTVCIHCAMRFEVQKLEFVIPSVRSVSLYRGMQLEFLQSGCSVEPRFDVSCFSSHFRVATQLVARLGLRVNSLPRVWYR